MADEVQWSNPFDEAGIEEMADWMAPQVRESPLFSLGIASGDAELLAVLLERLMSEYLEYRELPGKVRREGNLVYFSVDDDDNDQSDAVNMSVPLFRALMFRLRRPGPY